MNDTMIRRGPNDEGYYTNDHVAIAMRRLSIIDLSSGKQPIFNETRQVAIVFNGEIFNYQDLRKLLEQKSHAFVTDTDTETIVHLYEEFGDQCVQHLRGMFAFAIWDAAKRTLLIARDRIGIKPLFYSVVNGETLVFGSEIKTVLQYPGVDTTIDYQAMDAFFTYSYIPGEHTIYRGVKKLLPGHTMCINDKGIQIKKYWDIYFRPNFARTERETIEEFNEIFSQAVKMRLVSDVSLGAFLSGGVDSSLVVAHMARNMEKPTTTFTVGFGGTQLSYRRKTLRTADRTAVWLRSSRTSRRASGRRSYRRYRRCFR